MVIRDEKFLRTPSGLCNTVEEGQEIVKQLIAEAKLHNEAVGLSAPQIGILKRVFVVWNSTDRRWEGYINPRVVSTRPEKIKWQEGCLSFPKDLVWTERYESIVVTDETGLQYSLSGLDSVVFQHELDHLDGVLMFDRKTQMEIRKTLDVGRNEKCPCGSGKKYKKCCGE